MQIAGIGDTAFGMDHSIKSPLDSLPRLQALMGKGAFAEGEAVARELIRRFPNHELGWSSLGGFLQKQGNPQAALQALAAAVTLDPASAYHQYNLGLSLADPSSAFARAIKALPSFAAAHAELGMFKSRIGQEDEAKIWHCLSLALEPWQPHVLYNLGRSAQLSKQIELAGRSYRRSLHVNPRSFESHNNLAAIYAEQNWFKDALTHYKIAFSLARPTVELRVDLARCLIESGRLEAAIEHLTTAVILEPGNGHAWQCLARSMAMIGSASLSMDLIDRSFRCKPEDAIRFVLHYMVYDPRIGVEDAFERIRATLGIHSLRERPLPQNHHPLRIGYVSSDFRDHPVTRNLLPVMENRDRRDVFVACYSLTRRADAMTDRVRAAADIWGDISDMNNEAASRRIETDGIDILVLLAGRFDDNRPFIARNRPAPIQVSMHDAATSGMAEMDYLIADRILAPKHGRERFTERVLRLPHFVIHEPFESAPPIGPLPSASGAPPTFGSFNNPAKINERVLDLWGRVLRAIPGSRLVLGYKERYDGQILRERTRKLLGVSSDRITFIGGPARKIDDQLKLYNRIDIALDTFPFSGSTTSFEALWMGVPVLTLPGETMVSRWTLSMLDAIGLEGFAAVDDEDFIRRAQAYAAAPDELARIRSTLREKVATSPLCDGARYARHLDRLFKAIWARHIQ